MALQNMTRRNQYIDLSSAPWTMHEFFAGSGLVAYGLKGMFTPIWANDNSERKAAVYTANFGDSHFVLEDIRNVHGEKIPRANMSWASFPCQDLSLAGTREGIYGARSSLVWEWLRILDEMKESPKILVLENVIGLLSANNGEHYATLHNDLLKRGYKSGAIVMNASYFLPQSRPRVFIIAVKKECTVPHDLVGNGPSWLHNKAASELGGRLLDWIWWNTEKPLPRRQTIKDIVEKNVPFDKDHILRLMPKRHQEKLAEHDAVYATAYCRTRNGKQQLELRFDGIAGCLRTPEGGSSRQYLVIKKNGVAHARFLTVREAARLMGVPDDFILPGSYNDGYKAMGDAVAMPAAHFIGDRFLTKIAETVYHD
ncbi:DNA cytosine methyltransferase [Selenomonas sp.]|uniref:DNA cytosine methyltransferase n=1 Tax=Selenomonas sp. TaxID=2053611 RepID=UPI003FA28956